MLIRPHAECVKLIIGRYNDRVTKNFGLVINLKTAKRWAFWLIINVDGGPTDDKPEVLASPPRNQNILSIFLNLRVTDIRVPWTCMCNCWTAAE